MLAIRLPADIEKRLDALAKQTGRTKTYYAREAILSCIEDMEDTYIAIQRLESSEGTITHEELKAQLDLAD